MATETELPIYLREGPQTIEAQIHAKVAGILKKLEDRLAAVEAAVGFKGDDTAKKG